MEKRNENSENVKFAHWNFFNKTFPSIEKKLFISYCLLCQQTSFFVLTVCALYRVEHEHLSKYSLLRVYADFMVIYIGKLCTCISYHHLRIIHYII